MSDTLRRGGALLCYLVAAACFAYFAWSARVLMSPIDTSQFNPIILPLISVTAGGSAALWVFIGMCVWRHNDV